MNGSVTWKQYIVEFFLAIVLTFLGTAVDPRLGVLVGLLWTARFGFHMGAGLQEPAEYVVPAEPV